MIEVAKGCEGRANIPEDGELVIDSSRITTVGFAVGLPRGDTF